MRKGFTAKALSVLGATLLSGSVFAAASLDNIPSILITDKMSADEVAANPTTPFDYMATATQNIYRFTDAVDLASFINVDGATTMADVRFLFTEADDTGTLRATGQHLTVNQTLTGEAAIPDYAAVAAGNAVSTTDPLDFQNDAANPTQSPIVAPVITLPDIAIVTMFVASTETADQVDSTSFEVVTTNEAEYTSDGIYVSGAEAIACINTFDNWAAIPNNSIINPNVTPPTILTTTVPPTFTPTPVTVSDPGIIGGYSGAPAGTTSLRAASALSNGSSGITGFSPVLAFWQSHPNDDATLNPRIPTSAGDLIILRYSVQTAAAPATVSQQAQVRYRAGRPASDQTGVVVDEVLPDSPNHVDNAGGVHDLYYYAHADHDIIAAIDLYDDRTDLLMDITLSQIDAYRIPRSALAGGTILLNQGAAAVTVSAGEEAPPATGRADFVVGTTGWTALNVTGQTGRTFSTTGSGASVLVVNSTQTSTQALNHHSWETSDANQVVDIPNDTLVCLDVWMSSPNGSLTENDLPVNRIQLLNVAAGGGQGRDAYFEWSGAKDTTDLDVLALDATSKRYSVFMAPQLRNTAETIDLKVVILAEFYDLVLSGGNYVNTNNGTINIDRVVVTGYEIPGVGGSMCP